MGNCSTLIYIIEETPAFKNVTIEDLLTFENSTDTFLSQIMGNLEIEAPDYLVDSILKKVQIS